MNNPKLQAHDPELFEKVNKDLSFRELRGSEAILIQDWIAKALIAESLLGLLRKDLIDITGMTLDDENQVDLQFQISEYGKEFYEQKVNGH